MSTRVESWDEGEDVSVYEGTAGLSSAMQIVNSTSVSMNLQSLPLTILISPQIPQEHNEEKNESTFNEILDSVIKTHRKTLDALS